MESKQANVLIEGFEEKKKKNGENFWTVSTPIGKMNCFKPDVASLLATFKGKVCNIEFTDDGNWKNITNLILDPNAMPEEPTEKTPKDVTSQYPAAAKQNEFRTPRELMRCHALQCAVEYSKENPIGKDGAKPSIQDIATAMFDWLSE